MTLSGHNPFPQICKRIEGGGESIRVAINSVLVRHCPVPDYSRRAFLWLCKRRLLTNMLDMCIKATKLRIRTRPFWGQVYRCLTVRKKR